MAAVPSVTLRSAVSWVKDAGSSSQPSPSGSPSPTLHRQYIHDTRSYDGTAGRYSGGTSELRSGQASSCTLCSSHSEVGRCSGGRPGRCTMRLCWWRVQLAVSPCVSDPQSAARCSTPVDVQLGKGGRQQQLCHARQRISHFQALQLCKARRWRGGGGDRRLEEATEGSRGETPAERMPPRCAAPSAGRALRSTVLTQDSASLSPSSSPPASASPPKGRASRCSSPRASGAAATAPARAAAAAARQTHQGTAGPAERGDT